MIETTLMHNRQHQCGILQELLRRYGRVDGTPLRDRYSRGYERIRQALSPNDGLIGYAGSYGTVYAAAYLEHYGDHIKALVLDGVVDHSVDLPTFVVRNILSVNDAFDRFTAQRWHFWHIPAVLDELTMNGFHDAAYNMAAISATIALCRALIKKGVLAREDAVQILLDEAVTYAIQAEATQQPGVRDINRRCAEILKLLAESL